MDQNPIQLNNNLPINTNLNQNNTVRIKDRLQVLTKHLQWIKETITKFDLDIEKDKSKPLEEIIAGIWLYNLDNILI